MAVEAEVLDPAEDYYDVVEIDKAVLCALPSRIKVISATTGMLSEWTLTTRLSTILENGDSHDYFVKSSSGQTARAMCEGDYRSLDKLHNAITGMCPKPVGWGEYHSVKGTFFVVMDFVELDEVVFGRLLLPMTSSTGIDDSLSPSEGLTTPRLKRHVSPSALVSLIADLHGRTQGQSPGGNKFGFSVPNCHGKVMLQNDWDTDWSRYFTKLIRIFFNLDVTTNGSSPEYTETFERLVNNAIPPLLGALQANGRILTPSLVHGDLWHENIALRSGSDSLVLYDANTFYAHNEFDLGIWRTEFVPRAMKALPDLYRERIPPSEPQDEWEDRLLLYSLLFHISHSGHWEKAGLLRPVIMRDMKYLIGKYANNKLGALQTISENCYHTAAPFLTWKNS